LQKLEARGAVVRLDTPAGTRYAPVRPDELTRQLRTQFQSGLEAAQESLGQITGAAEPEYVWNIRGYPALVEHARSVLSATKERLLVAITPAEARGLAADLNSADNRGVDITTLCLEACASECGACRGRIYRYPAAPDKQSRWLVLVSDGAELLAGEINSEEETLAVRTRQPLLVELASWYTRHSIALAVVLNDLGGRLEDLLRPETRSVLESMGPAEPNGGWLGYMRRLLGRRASLPGG
jgi:hypothetical protein